MPGLTADERARFARDGWVGPFRLLEPGEARALAPELARCFTRTRGYFYPTGVRPGDVFYDDAIWFQSLHTLSPAIAAVGRRPEIVDRVASLLGDDLLQWAGIRFEQAPGDALHWHTDTEFDYFRGVGAWLGIQGTTPRTALKIIPGSHRYATTPEDLQREHGLAYEDLTADADVARWLRSSEPAADPRIQRVPVHDGEFVLIDGKLWHASDNPGRIDRIAMGLRYSPPDQRIRIPLTYLHPVIFDPTPPPCLLVRGEDRSGCNRVVDPPG
jgi:non-heme Fe2+,alpha-ketoglutarate-dependent halogenase